MNIVDIFSRRQAVSRGEIRDVYIYDEAPSALRVQLIYLLRDYLGNEADAKDRNPRVLAVYQLIVETLCREYGVFRLSKDKSGTARNFMAELFHFIQFEYNVERMLDAVELAFRAVDEYARRRNYRNNNDSDKQADAALKQLNARFQQHGFGYRYESGFIIRIDSELVHAEIVKPALSLLHNRGFEGAEAEFHLAYEHYRHDRMKEALAECLKSLESTIKTIAARRGWTHEPNATARSLIDLLFQKELIPSFWSSHFSGLRGMLEGGVPTARNRLGGHGQGETVVDVPPHLVAFAIHQTAAAIVFFATADSRMP